MAEEKKVTPQGNGNKVDNRDKEMEALKKQIEMLTKVVDQGQLQREIDRNQVGEEKQYSVRLGLIHGKVIVKSEGMAKDDVYLDGSGMRIEDQILRFWLDGDKEHTDMELRHYLRILDRTDYIKVDNISMKIIDERPVPTEYEVTYEGKTYKLDPTVVNF